MIKARIIPKSWLKTYHTAMGYTTGNRGSEYLWDNSYRPEVECMFPSNDDDVRLWRLTSTPEGTGGHQVDLFIDRHTLLDETIEAYGGVANTIRALARRITD